MKDFRDHLYNAEHGPRVEESRHGCYRFKGEGTIKDGYPFFKFLEAGLYLKVVAILNSYNTHTHIEQTQALNIPIFVPVVTVSTQIM